MEPAYCAAGYGDEQKRPHAAPHQSGAARDVGCRRLQRPAGEPRDDHREHEERLAPIEQLDVREVARLQDEPERQGAREEDVRGQQVAPRLAGNAHRPPEARHDTAHAHDEGDDVRLRCRQRLPSNQPAEHGRERRDDEHRGGGDAADPRLDHAVLHDCCQQLLVRREAQRSDRVDGRQRGDREVEEDRVDDRQHEDEDQQIEQVARGAERPPRDVADRPPALADAGEQRGHVVHGAEENAANHDPQPHRLPSEGERQRWTHDRAGAGDRGVVVSEGHVQARPHEIHAVGQAIGRCGPRIVFLEHPRDEWRVGPVHRQEGGHRDAERDEDIHDLRRHFATLDVILSKRDPEHRWTAEHDPSTPMLSRMPGDIHPESRVTLHRATCLHGRAWARRASGPAMATCAARTSAEWCASTTYWQSRRSGWVNG